MKPRLILTIFMTAGLLFGLVGNSGCASWQPHPPVAVETQEWKSPTGFTGQQLITEHYDMHITAKDDVLCQYIPPFMETTFAKYCDLKPAPVETNEQLAIYLFETRREWVDFTRHFAPQQADTYLHIQSGGYTDQPRATAVAYDLGRDLTLSLLAHEGMHQYLARYFPETIPAWLNEGLATQWEAFDLRGDRPVFRPRKNFMRTNDLREALNTELIPLPELLNMHAGDAVRKTGRKVRTYYAQIWSMFLFLREGPYAEKFAVLLQDAGTNRQKIALKGYKAVTSDAAAMSDGEILFRQYITEDYDKFINEYREYARLLVY